MLKLGYILAAHNNPTQVLRLMQALESDENHIFFHVDKGADIRQFTDLEGIQKLRNLTFLPRYSSPWGGIGIVEATLTGIRAALKAQCDYIILLSGADYPLKSNAEINNFLANSNGKSFVSYYKMPAPYWLPDTEGNRIKKYYFHVNHVLFEYPMPAGVKTLPRRLLNFALSLFLKKERVFPPGIIPYGGDQWFCLSRKASEEILDFDKRHPEVMRFMKYCLVPDEIFFQTAILNSGSKSLIDSVVNDTITHINWKNKNAPSPVLFTPEDFDSMMASQKLFGRKFDMQKYPELMDKIDAARASK